MAESKHLFGAEAFAPSFRLPQTLCGRLVVDTDISVSAYRKLELDAQTGGMVGGRLADDALAAVCKICEKIADAG